MLLVLLLLSEAPWAVLGSLHCDQTSSGVIRPHSVAITEFGAVGDGVTLNTKAFQNAIFYLNSFADKGGAQLFVPAGWWLTGSFDLISHLTLWLDKDAVILGSMVSLHLLLSTYTFKTLSFVKNCLFVLKHSSFCIFSMNIMYYNSKLLNLRKGIWELVTIITATDKCTCLRKCIF